MTIEVRSSSEIGEVRFEIEGGGRVRDYVAGLYAIERLYEGLLTVDRILADPRASELRPYSGSLGAVHVATAVLPDEHLLLVSIEASSPGHFSLLGNLNVLEQIRLWLNDRAERRKDRDYRNREEERRLGIENDQRDTDLIRSRIAAMREAGLSELEIAELVRAHMDEPMDQLGRAQDSLGLGQLPPADDASPAIT